MKSLKTFLGVTIASFLLMACKNQVSFKKTKSGVPYKIFSDNKSKDTIAIGSIIKYNIIRRVTGNGKVKDSLLTTTYGKMPVYQQVAQSSGSYGDPLMDVIVKAKKGDSIYMTQAMDSFIAHQPDIVTQTPFRKGDHLITTIKVIDVFKTGELAQADYEKTIKAEEALAPKVLEKYLADNHVQAQKTAGGVYMQVLSPGQGPKPVTGQFVKVQYKGTHLSGQPFDEGIYPFQTGANPPAAIPGFEDAIMNMQKGEKAKVYIPASLAYGARGSAPDQRGGPQRIAPNENLVFELTLLDISDKSLDQQPQFNPADTTRQ